MRPYWSVFYDTGDPLAYILYREAQVLTGEDQPPEPTDEKEATPWQPPPIS